MSNKKFTLVDADISTVKESPASSRPKYWTKASSVVIALAVGSAALSGCSDDKPCTDADRGADPYVYDTGQFADPYDFGGDSDTGVADPAGNGDLCRDYD
ncbi:MAG: hypothetical protein MK081_00555 [Flavobacteriales bacterium]|uniref:hypothetical protein n=1 Tax=Sanyastnella coralliicola TaxID=3069118 RepID=UPI0027B9B906|nr:hypothetical protein [Longitalea sp. SCSIO 12813]MCH2197245.1 hypothetical protein [Flavobacteriales bacterium]